MGIRSLRTASISTGTKRSKVWDQSAVYSPTAFESIATVALSSTASTITFSSIPSTYKHLQIRMLAGYTGSVGSGYIAFNGDNASGNYSHHGIGGNGVSSDAPGAVALTSQNQGKYTGYAGTSPAARNSMIMDILDYTDTNKYKTVKALYAWDANGTGYVEFNSNLWLSTSAITSIVLTPANTFDTATHVALYGIKG